MKLLLHIGTPKTGTTSIQNYLYNNKERLISEGYYYFTLENIRKIFNKNHLDDTVHLLVAYFLENHGYYIFNNCESDEDKKIFKNNILEKYLNEIKKIPKNIHTVIMSSEQFFQLLEEKNIFILKTLLYETFKEIKVLCYIRPQCEKAISFFSTKLLSGWGGHKDLEKSLYEDLTIENKRYNYFEALLSWEKNFGFENIILKVYEKDQFINSDLLDDFTSLIDKKLIGNLVKTDNHNASLDHFGHVLIKSFNKHFPEYSKFNTDKTNYHSDFRSVISNFCRDGKTLKIPFERYSELQKRFSKPNNDLKKKYFPEKSFLFKDKLNYDSNVLMTKNHEELLDQVIKLFSNWMKK